MTSRLYDEAVITALTLIWEAADRICGKRLKAVLTTFVESMRSGVFTDTFRRPCLARARTGRNERSIVAGLIRSSRSFTAGSRRRCPSAPKSIAIRTYEDWNNPQPGYFEMDLVAHCGSSVAGSHVHSLVLTDLASSWTEAAALMMREQTLITVTLDEGQSRLPFSMLGLDVDNDSAFIKRAPC